MTPEISEFSYGFALTNEIVGWTPLKAAPIFPSLIEEGKKGGGYDVRLAFPGAALYLQFKRAHCMVRGTAMEIRQHHLGITIPFHRFYITESGKSDQHQMLLELDDGMSAVFYVAPRFHRMDEINAAWASNAVASRSIFVAPRSIGELDTATHHVAYDLQRTFICSEPKAIESLSSEQVAVLLRRKLEKDKRSLADKLPELTNGMHEAIQRAIPKMSMRAKTRRERREFVAYASDIDAPSASDQALRKVAMRDPEALSPQLRQLRELADKAQKVFGAQLVVVQEGN
jgi:hypothetical protein